MFSAIRVSFRQLGSDDESESSPRSSSNLIMGRASRLASSDTSPDPDHDHDGGGSGTGHLQHAVMGAQSLGVGEGSAVGVAWGNRDGIGGLHSIGAEVCLMCVFFRLGCCCLP